MTKTEEIMELADKYSDSVIGDYLNETHTKYSKSRAVLKSAIEELIAERDKLCDELRVEKINTECYLTGAKKIHDELRRKLYESKHSYKQVGYMAHIDGKPCWDADDVVCVDAVWPAGPDDDRVSVPVFAREAEGLRTLVKKVHEAKGRYHSQIAMANLYEACGLPFVRPVKDAK